MYLKPERALEAPRSRFASVFTDACDKPAYDRVLIDLGDYVVVPTLGAVVPRWVLIIPRRHSVNFLAHSQCGGGGAFSLVETVRNQLKLGPESIVWFEHGPLTPGSSMGCGVEHAHIHVLIAPPFDLASLAREAKAQCEGLRWKETDSLLAYQSLSGEHPYLIAGNGTRAVLSELSHDVGSQFFRRAVAKIVGDGEAWDYRSFPHMQNIAETRQFFAIAGITGAEDDSHSK